MTTLSFAFSRAVKSLAQPRVLWHVLWPTLAAALIWVPVSIVGARIVGEWVGGAGEAISFGLPPEVFGGASVSLGGVGKWMTWAMFLLLAYPMIYLTSALIVATIALPLIVQSVVSRDYARLERKRGGSFLGSLGNALGASVSCVMLTLLSLPLWLVPGLAFILPLVFAAFLSWRTYPYDALLEHASHREREALLRTHRGTLWCLALATAALAYVPVINFFAPAFAGLVFVHFCLEALRHQRAQARAEGD